MNQDHTTEEEREEAAIQGDLINAREKLSGQAEARRDARAMQDQLQEQACQRRY